MIRGLCCVNSVGLFEQANGGTLFLDEIGDISPKVQARLLRVSREVTDALMAEGDSLTLEDMPPTFKRLTKATVSYQMGDLNEEERFILKAIAHYEKQKEPCGREKLSAYSMGTPYCLSKYQMRHRLEQLEVQGYVTLGRGKVGVHLTSQGAEIIR